MKIWHHEKNLDSREDGLFNKVIARVSLWTLVQTYKPRLKEKYKSGMGISKGEAEKGKCFNCCLASLTCRKTAKETPSKKLQSGSHVLKDT